MSDSSRVYHDSEGNECTIGQMIKNEPYWAANIIQWYEDQQTAAVQTRKEIGERLSKWSLALNDEGDGEWSISFEGAEELRSIIETLKRGEIP